MKTFSFLYYLLLIVSLILPFGANGQTSETDSKTDSLISVLGNGNQYFDEGFQFNFKLSYFNTPSSKLLYEALRKLDKIYLSGTNIFVNWYYEDDVELEEVESIMTNLKIPFKYVKGDLSDSKSQ